ncbi:hypothetical protein BU17DRAFT_70821 [Hysterangium stoloniferum]|nr:hypothetical protein BU17DRAFT_70821 [Hysterangium stoloniferum]
MSCRPLTPSKGHVRPLCAFIARVVQLQPAWVTFLIAGDNICRVKAEFAQYFRAPHVKGLMRYIRYVWGHLSPSLENNIYSRWKVYKRHESMYQDMLRIRPVTCAWTGDLHLLWIRPTLVIADICSHFAISSIRKISGQSVPVLAWVATPASSLLCLFGEEMRGGIGDLEGMIEEKIYLHGDRKREDVAAEIYRSCRGSIIKVPGLPDHYDYEWHPQEPRSPSRIPWVIHKGALSLSCEAYEPISARAVHEWFAEDGRDFFCVGVGTVNIELGDSADASRHSGSGHLKGTGSVSGAGNEMLKTAPVLALGVTAELGTTPTPRSTTRPPTSSSDAKVYAHLEMAFEKYGKHSLVYIAFGSVFWPKESEHVWEMISTLLDLEIPFIFSHASLDTAVPQCITERVRESGVGLMLEWTPQGDILEHQATGWFVSHCGANSVLESLYHGVPLLRRSLSSSFSEGDQPANAAYLTTSLNVSYELIQVRTGVGRRRMYRHGSPNSTPAPGCSSFNSEIPLSSVRAEFRDILGRARGPDGENKRENAMRMGEKLAKAWGEGGVSKETIKRFVQKFILNE